MTHPAGSAKGYDLTIGEVVKNHKKDGTDHERLGGVPPQERGNDTKA